MMPWRPPRPLNPLPQRCRRPHHPRILRHSLQRASQVAQMPHLSMPSGMWRLPNDPYRESLPYRRLCHAVSPPNRHSPANPSSLPSSFSKTASPQPHAKLPKPPKPPRRPQTATPQTRTTPILSKHHHLQKRCIKTIPPKATLYPCRNLHNPSCRLQGNSRISH